MDDFFSTSVRELSSDEVDSLYEDRVQENIRLEYKRELPQETADFRQVLAKRTVLTGKHLWRLPHYWNCDGSARDSDRHGRCSANK